MACWDLETGKQLWQRRMVPLMLEGLPSGGTPARPALPEEQVAKVQKLIDLAQALWTVTDCGPGVGASDGGRERSDNKAMARFVVVDAKDPTSPKVVSDKNLLGFAEPPSDIFIEQYYKDIDPFQFVGCYAGAVSHFMRMGGMVPVGNRLLIQTPAFLYCIGEE